MSFLHKARDLQAGAVAAGHKVTADAAARTLNDGGNAFQAAAAGLIAACLAEPVFASPGGGGFMTARHRSGKTEVLDFFVDLPGQKQSDAHVTDVEADFGSVRQLFHIGAGTSAVPGMEAGLTALFNLGNTANAHTVHTGQATHTGLTIQQLFRTALASAEGLTVSPLQAKLFEIVSPILQASDPARSLYAPEGKLLAEGDAFNNAELLRLFNEFAERSDASFNGMCEIDRVLQQQVDEGGHIRADDFSDYVAQLRDPTRWENTACRVFSNALPAMGGVLSLAMLSADSNPSSPLSGRADAIAQVDRFWRSGRSGSEIAEKFKVQAKQSEQSGTRDGFNGTTHISVIDRHGNAVAVTVTNGEGNGQIVPGRGYMLNNMLGEEDVNPEGPTRWQPQPKGQRRLSSMMAPTIADGADGTLLALGSGGSNRIRTALYQVLANRFLTGMGIREAVHRPRIHGERRRLDIEDYSNQPEAKALEGVFPETEFWQEQSLYFGGVHAVERNPRGRFDGAGDPRREGVFVVVD
ncbi:gamma-glutamyltransferase [Pararhizobium sp. IMCC21322]|uniref:gamma-glutamyltransferase n=1 Tax=Pararhizobium sp. IMCC21322 TaxID=3067903 RepID=UPI002741F6BB|nr:gamma-glutamyltransferase [Pararhizobium sp. IMCC21322]